MSHRKREGFTLIEAIMVMVIIGILSIGGAYLMVYLVQNSVFIPNKLNMDMLASDALDIMIEGDSLAKGLRFSRSITNIQDNEIAFINQDSQSIRYRLNAGRLYRSITGEIFSVVPYYLTSGINITGKDNKLFTYYRANENNVSENETTNPDNVRRIKIALIARTGTGSYADWQGQSEQASSIAVKRFP